MSTHSNRTSKLLSTSVLCSKVALAGFAVTLFGAKDANALPTGGQVESGNITINQPNGNNLVITQGSDRGIINWQGFDILAGESTQFIQPGSNSVTLNRIGGGSPSQILGKLSANGKLVLVNPNGVFFGAGSTVDVAGMVASTADIKSADFNAGRMNFSQPGKADASIINQGTITATDGGLVALVAPSVRNDGVIQAKYGTVALAAGETVAIDMYGDNLYSFAVGKTKTAGKDQNGNSMTSAVENNGAINAGTVILTANAAKDIVTNVVNNTGVIEASNAHMEGGTVVLDGGSSGKVRVAGKITVAGKAAGTKGGKVTVTGQQIALEGAQIDATGQAGGGTVLIGGNYQGAAGLAQSGGVSTDASTFINVSALDKGNGGEAVLWSTGVTDFNGTIHAKGGANGGNGGRIETSGDSLNVTGNADATAAHGKAGSWLLDPRNIIVSNLPNFQITTVIDPITGNTIDPTGNAANVRTNSITTALNNGTDVTITTGNTGSQAGNVTIISDVNWSGTGSLNVLANNDISVTANIKSTTALSGGNISLNAGNNLTIASGLSDVSVSTNAGNINLNAGNNVSVQANGLGNTRVQSTAGNIGVNAGGAISVTSGVTGKDAVIMADAGNVTLGGSSLTLSTDSQAIGGDSYISAGKDLTASITNNVNLLKGAFMKASTGALKVLQGGIFHSDTANSLSNNAGSAGSVWVNQNAGAGSSIQNAVDAVGTTGSGGGTVNLGAGTWTEKVNIDQSNFTLQGNNPASTIIKAPTSVADNGNAVIYVHDADAVTVKNLQVDGMNRGAAGQSNYGIAFINAGGNISGNTVTNVGSKTLTASQNGYGVGIIGMATNGIGRTVTAENNTVNNFQKNAIVMYGSNITGNVNSNIISGIGATSSSVQNGVVMQQGARGAVFGNTISNIGYTPTDYASTGILLYNAGAGIQVAGNTITGTNTTDAGIYTYNTAAANVHNNTVSGAKFGLYTDGATSYVASNNVLNNNSTGAYITNSNGAILNNNRVTGNGDQNGFTIKKSDGAILRNNNIDLSTAGADQWAGKGTAESITDSNNVSILNETIKNAGGSMGIIANNSDNLYVNMSSVDGGKIGVGLYNGSDSGVINNSTFQSLYVGIDATGTNNVQAFNNTLSNTQTGINVTNGTGNTFILSNTLNLASMQEGIHVKNTADAQIINNMIDGGVKGVNIDASNNALVLGGKITNATDGVYVSGSDKATIDSVNIQNGTNGVNFVNSTNGTAKNNIVGYVDNGVVGSGSTGLTIDKNKISNTGNGVLLASGSDNATVSNNTITSSTNGVALSNSDGVTVDSNDITALTSGIKAVASNSVNILKNKIHNAAQAISLTGSEAARVVQNAINGNGDQNGIAVTNSNNALLDRNTIDLSTAGADVWGGKGTAIAVTNSSDVTITGGSIKDAGGMMGIIANNSDYLSVSNVKIDGGKIGVGLYNGSDSAFLTSNTLSNLYVGVDAQKVDGLTAFNNSFDNMVTGINIADSTGLIQAMGNNFNLYNGQEGIHVKNTDGSMLQYNNITGGTTGIFVENSNGTAIAGGNITKSTTGINVKDSQFANISGVTMNGSTNAIYLNNGDSATVAGNFINAVENGVLANNNSSGLMVIDNQFTGGQAAVQLSAGSNNATVQQNTISGVKDGVKAYYSNGVKVLNNVISAANNGIISGANKAVEIVGNSVNTTSSTGVGISSSNDTGVKIATNAVSGGTTGVKLNGSTGASVTGNRVSNTGTGITAQGTPSLILTGNDVYNTTGKGITVNNAAGSTLSDNLVYNTGDNGISVTNSANSAIGGNFVGYTYRSPALLGLAGNIKGDGISVDASNGSTITGNKVAQTASTAYDIGSGIHVTNSDLVNVASNDLFNIAWDGIKLGNSSNITAFNNTLLNTARVGIYAGNTNGLTVAGNHVNNANTSIGGAGAIMTDGGSNITIRNNFVNDAAVVTASTNGHGISVNNASGANSIYENNVQKVTEDGIHVTGSPAMNVHDNTIKTANNGVYLTGSNNSDVRQNTIRDVNNGVVVSNTSGVHVEDNFITAAQNGIVSTFNALFRAMGNTIDGTNSVGINVADSAGAMIWANDISSSNAGILLVDSAGSTLLDNHTKNADNGISVKTSASTMMQGNWVSNTGNAGILVSDSAGSTIKESVIHDTGGAAIDVVGSDNVSILDNLVGYNDRLTVGSAGNIRSNGIAVDSSNGTIINGNIVTQVATGGAGITLLSSNDALITNNNLTGNSIGVALTNSNDGNLSGNIFSGNMLGVDLNNSLRTKLTNETFNIAAGGTGIQIRNGSGSTIVEDNHFTGGSTAILLDGLGSDMQFAGEGSTFDGMDFYFVLRNNAMQGSVLDASGQSFAGVRGRDMTVAELDAAEAKTIDVEDTGTVGDVFYRPRPIIGGSGLDEFDRDRRDLYRKNLFSYSGRTLGSNIMQRNVEYNVASIDLSLLSKSAPITNSTQVANFFATLAPAAGGKNAEALAKLAPGAGGNNPQQFASATPTATALTPVRVNATCGNNFLGDGFAPGFNCGVGQ